MEHSEFTIQFKQLVETYRNLTARLNDMPNADVQTQQQLMQQIQQNVRQQNALRQQYKPKENT
jgi:cell shape-determining protein MreC